MPMKPTLIVSLAPVPAVSEGAIMAPTPALATVPMNPRLDTFPSLRVITYLSLHRSS